MNRYGTSRDVGGNTAPKAKLLVDASAACTCRAECLGDAEFVAGMSAKGIVMHALLGDLLR
jgi:hypothetical protein